MKLATFILDGKQETGVLHDEKLYAFSLFGMDFSSMQDFIERHTKADMETLRRKISGNTVDGVSITEITLCSPIPNPRHDLICVGQNYLGHAAESARFFAKEPDKSPYPVFFSKRAHMTVPPQGVIRAHTDITEKLDYEGELAVIIGRTCNHIEKRDVYGHIFGYTIVNDVSARDIQQNHKQYYFGKGLDGATPMGPVIVTADEVGVPPHLNIKTRVNGETRQDANTRDFIYGIPYLVSMLSKGITLYPGDILATGTPQGVGMGFSPPKFLRPGDIVECEIEKIGTLRNTVGE